MGNLLAIVLFQYQPWEVVPILFNYFAQALKGVPEEKIEEFGREFLNGVKEAMRG